jgi:hypothetical protein
MRHIPEEELHAYLDQALSRLQCVEIESHLAECCRCRSARDEIAALRDQTTALLATLAPTVRQAPPFETIRARSQQIGTARRRRVTTMAWAASMAAALFAGWEANQWLARAPAPPDVLQAASRPAEPATTASRAPTRSASPVPVSPVPSVALVTPQTTEPAALAASVPREVTFPVVPVVHATTLFRPEPVPQALLAVAAAGPQLYAGWRPVPLGQADTAGGTRVPRVSGLPIVQVLVQEVGTDTEVTAVDQKLDTGETIRTIEGPAAKVETLIAQEQGRERPRDEDGAGQQKATLILRQGDRMVALTGPSDVLHNLVARVTVRHRP